MIFLDVHTYIILLGDVEWLGYSPPSARTRGTTRGRAEKSIRVCKKEKKTRNRINILGCAKWALKSAELHTCSVRQRHRLRQQSVSPEDWVHSTVPYIRFTLEFHFAEIASARIFG